VDHEAEGNQANLSLTEHLFSTGFGTFSSLI